MNINFFIKLLAPLFLKGLGMIISFGSVFIIIDYYGLEIFGKYSQTLSFLLLMSGIVSYGYPQSIFRDSALLNFFEKKKLFNQMLLITSYTSIIILPLIIFFFFTIEKKSAFQITILILSFLLLSTSRLRFALFRTTKYVQFSEAPEQILKPIIILVTILILEKNSITSLYIGLFLGLLGAFLLNNLILKKYYSFPKKLTINKDLINFNINNTNTQLWLSNVLILFKDFIELYFIGYLLGDNLSGEYKVILQIYIVLMSVYNTMALINSMSYAQLIAKEEYSEVNKKAKTEMIPSLTVLSLIVIVLIVGEITFNISKLLNLSKAGLYSILVFMFFSFINILFGPITQLLVHSRQIKKVILITFMKIITVCISVLMAYFSKSEFQLLIFSISMVLSEIIVLAIMSKSLKRTINYNVPILENLLLRK